MKKINLNLYMIVLTLILLIFNNCSKVGDIDIYDPINDPTKNPNLGPFLADSNEQNRTALLEEFTGVQCQYCPEGHEIAKTLLAAHPGKFIAISIHCGPYAGPAAGWPNFTAESDWVKEYVSTLVGQAKLTGYPAGTISRIPANALHVDPQIPNGYALDRDKWEEAANFVMSQSAPVNIGIKTSYNASTRYLCIKTDFYYTQTQPGENVMYIALLQDKLVGKQMVAPNPDPVTNYEQNNVFRDLITGQYGWDLSDTGVVKGRKIRLVLNYEIPASFNGTSADGGGAVVLSNLKIVVFVCAGNVNVLNAKMVKVL
jgi:hypothetical protein